MKKHLLWLSILFFAALPFKKQVMEIVKPVKAEDKQISLAIYANNNYTYKVYDEALAKVHVTVTKVKGNSKTVVWEKSFDAMPLSSYPTISDAITQEVSIPKVFDAKEELLVSYSITYESKGSVLEFVSREVVSKGSKKGSLFIAI
jgi:hypothetical protein